MDGLDIKKYHSELGVLMIGRSQRFLPHSDLIFINIEGSKVHFGVFPIYIIASIPVRITRGITTVTVKRRMVLIRWMNKREKFL